MTQLEAQPSEPRPGKPWPGEPLPGGPLPGGPLPAGPLPGELTLAAARFFAARLAGSWVPAYLAGRGFGEQALRPWTVGYAPAGWRVLTAHLRDLGYGAAAIQAAGLARRTRRGALVDFFRDRAMFWIRWPDGTVAGFTGRARPGGGQAGPVYLNSRTTGLYRKGSLLFGLYEGRRALAAGARPVLVEGPLDAIAVSAVAASTAGSYAGVSPCGTALTPAQVTLLARTCDLRQVGVVVAFDADPAGRRAAVRAYHLLRGVTDHAVAAVLPAGQDPAGFRRERGGRALARRLDAGVPLVDLVVDETMASFERWLAFPDGKFAALHAAAPLVAGLPSGQVARQVVRVARRLGLSYAEVTDAVTGALRAPE
jgi:DNA primase